MGKSGWFPVKIFLSTNPLNPAPQLMMMLFFSFGLLPGFYRGYYDIEWSTWSLLSALLVTSGTLLFWRPKNQADFTGMFWPTLASGNGDLYNGINHGKIMRKLWLNGI